MPHFSVFYIYLLVISVCRAVEHLSQKPTLMQNVRIRSVAAFHSMHNIEYNCTDSTYKLKYAVNGIPFGISGDSSAARLHASCFHYQITISVFFRRNLSTRKWQEQQEITLPLYQL